MKVNYMSDPRYQHQSRVVKIVRWLRWKPYCASVAVLLVLRWLVTGYVYEPQCFNHASRKQSYPSYVWFRWFKVEAAIGMKHLLDISEIVAQLRSKR